MSSSSSLSPSPSSNPAPVTPTTTTPPLPTRTTTPTPRKKLAPGGRHRCRRPRYDHNATTNGQGERAKSHSPKLNDCRGKSHSPKPNDRRGKSHSPKPNKPSDHRKNKSKSPKPQNRRHHQNHIHHHYRTPNKHTGPKHPAAMTIIVARIDLLDGAAAQAAAAAEMASREHPHLIVDDDEEHPFMTNHPHNIVNLGGVSLHNVGLEVMSPPPHGGGRCRPENYHGGGNSPHFYYFPTLNSGGNAPPVLPYHFFDPSSFETPPPQLLPTSDYASSSSSSSSSGGGSSTSEGAGESSGSEGYIYSSPSPSYQHHHSNTVVLSSGEGGGEDSGPDRETIMMTQVYPDPAYCHSGTAAYNHYNGGGTAAAGMMISAYNNYHVATQNSTNTATIIPNNMEVVPTGGMVTEKAVAVVRAPLSGVMFTPTPKHNKNNRNHHRRNFGSDGSNSSFDDDVMDNSVPNPHPSSVVHDKYWAQRRRLFSRFDQGIQLDSEGWFSVTPEKIADHVASRMGHLGQELIRQRREIEFQIGHYGLNSENNGIVVLDAFCGCGGNAIAFGKLPPSMVSLVVCVDVDRSKLRKAAHNASLYGIPTDKLVFVECSTLDVMGKCYRNGELVMRQCAHEDKGGAGGGPPSSSFLKRLVPGAGGKDPRKVTPEERHAGYRIGGTELLPPHIDAVFMDPPWGGIDYGLVGKNGYDLAKHMKIPTGPLSSVSSTDDEPKQTAVTAKGGDEAKGDNAKKDGYVDGFGLLKMAASATSSRIVVFDVPRNTNKSSVGRAALAAGYRGNIKLEEHFLNGRLKTVSYYLGGDYSSLLH